jgi:cytochrome c553
VKRVAALALAAFSACVPAADSPPGRAKAQPCTPCHGARGISVAPDAPHLAGQPRLYVEQQLKAFRSGARRHEVMNIVAKPLSDGDIAALAEWYASIPIEAKEPP